MKETCCGPGTPPPPLLPVECFRLLLELFGIVCLHVPEHVQFCLANKTYYMYRSVRFCSFCLCSDSPDYNQYTAYPNIAMAGIMAAQDGAISGKDGQQCNYDNTGEELEAATDKDAHTLGNRALGDCTLVPGNDSGESCKSDTQQSLEASVAGEAARGNYRTETESREGMGVACDDVRIIKSANSTLLAVYQTGEIVPLTECPHGEDERGGSFFITDSGIPVLTALAFGPEFCSDLQQVAVYSDSNAYYLTHSEIGATIARIQAHHLYSFASVLSRKPIAGAKEGKLAVGRASGNMAPVTVFDSSDDFAEKQYSIYAAAAGTHALFEDAPAAVVSRVCYMEMTKPGMATRQQAPLLAAKCVKSSDKVAAGKKTSGCNDDNCGVDGYTAPYLCMQHVPDVSAITNLESSTNLKNMEVRTEAAQGSAVQCVLGNRSYSVVPEM